MHTVRTIVPLFVLCLALLGLGACSENSESAKVDDPMPEPQMETAETAQWLEFHDAGGKLLRVKFYEQVEAGIAEPTRYMDIELDGVVHSLPQVSEQNGEPVYGKSEAPALTIVTYGGGGRVELFLDGKGTMFE